MYIGLHVKYPLFLSDFNETEFSRQILKNPQISNSIKIRLVGAELYHADGWADGRTDMTKLLVALRNFAKALIMIPKP
jgi:hypothetical protein